MSWNNLIPADSLVRGSDLDPWRESVLGEFFGPSIVKLAAPETNGCLTAWSFRYLHGFPDVPRRGRCVGRLYHSGIEAHYDPRQSVYDPRYDPDDLKSLRTWAESGKAELAEGKVQAVLEHVPRMVEKAVPYLPRAEDCLRLDVEKSLDLGWPASHLDLNDPLKSRGTPDLVVQFKSGSWLLTDHKGTAGGYPQDPPPGKKRRVWDPWLYVPSAEDLIEDLQPNLYAYWVMYKHNLQELPCRWLYNVNNPERPAQAKPVDFVMRQSDVIRRLIDIWMPRALRLREWVRWAKANGPPPQDLTGYPDLRPPNPNSPCMAYGGCDYHPDSGGPCLVSGNLGDRIAAAEIKKERKPMITQQLQLQGIAMQPQAAPQAAPQAPAQPPQQYAAPPQQYAAPPQQYAAPPAGAPVPGGAVVPAPAPTPAPEPAEKKPANKRRPRKRKDETDAEYAARVAEYEQAKAGAVPIQQVAPAAPVTLEPPALPAPAEQTVPSEPENYLSEFGTFELFDELVSRGFSVTLSRGGQ